MLVSRIITNLLAAALRRRARGNALLELALLLPLLCLLLLGVFDLGRMYSEQVTIVAAAREGARSAMYLGDDAEVRAIVVTNLNSVVTVNPATDIRITRDLTSTQTVSIHVTYRHTLLFGLLSNVANGGRLTLQAHATMPVGQALDVTPAPVNTPPPTGTPEPTETPTVTPTNTATATATRTPTNTPTVIGTATATPVVTQTPTRTAVATATATRTPGATATATPPAAATNTPTAPPAATNTPTAPPAATSTPTAPPAATSTPTWTPMPPASATPSRTPTNAPTSTPTSMPTTTPTPSRTPTITATATPGNCPLLVSVVYARQRSSHRELYVQVYVTDLCTGAPVTGATVTASGLPITFTAASQTGYYNSCGTELDNFITLISVTATTGSRTGTGIGLVTRDNQADCPP